MTIKLPCHPLCTRELHQSYNTRKVYITHGSPSHSLLNQSLTLPEFDSLATINH